MNRRAIKEEIATRESFVRNAEKEIEALRQRIEDNKKWIEELKISLIKRCKDD